MLKILRANMGTSANTLRGKWNEKNTTKCSDKGLSLCRITEYHW